MTKNDSTDFLNPAGLDNRTLLRCHQNTMEEIGRRGGLAKVFVKAVREKKDEQQHYEERNRYGSSDEDE